MVAFKIHLTLQLARTDCVDSNVLFFYYNIRHIKTLKIKNKLRANNIFKFLNNYAVGHLKNTKQINAKDKCSRKQRLNMARIDCVDSNVQFLF